MSEDSGSRPILSASEARKLFALYFGLKLLGLAAIFGGVFLSRGGATPVAVVLLLIGVASLFVRPRMLGLTSRREP